MKAIIITDAEARSLLEQLELKALREKNRVTPDEAQQIDEIHRAFHYVVTRWLHEMGCDTVRP